MKLYDLTHTETSETSIRIYLPILAPLFRRVKIAVKKYRRSN